MLTYGECVAQADKRLKLSRKSDEWWLVTTVMCRRHQNSFPPAHRSLLALLTPSNSWGKDAWVRDFNAFFAEVLEHQMTRNA